MVVVVVVVVVVMVVVGLDLFCRLVFGVFGAAVIKSLTGETGAYHTLVVMAVEAGGFLSTFINHPWLTLIYLSSLTLTVWCLSNPSLPRPPSPLLAHNGLAAGPPGAPFLGSRRLRELARLPAQRAEHGVGRIQVEDACYTSTARSAWSESLPLSMARLCRQFLPAERLSQLASPASLVHVE